MKKFIAFGMTALFAAAIAAHAQPPQRADRPRPTTPAGKEDALDPSPVNPATDPKLNLFLNDWRNSKPRTESGKLVFHDILTKLDSSDPVHPHKPGAVLTGITSVSYATLAPGASASGRMKGNEREIFYTVSGNGKVEANGKPHDVQEGVGFTLTPSFDFKLTNTGKAPLAFYVRRENIPASAKPSADMVVVNRFDNDRRIGAHWVHTCNGGPQGMSLCTIAPSTMPQPHSHAGEEAWIMVKGDSILSLGKNLVKMHPGQAYKIPPTGISAHSNLNLGNEPVEMIFMGPAERGDGPAPAAVDYARLDNAPINRATEPDADMFMGNWKDAWPRVAHGNLYIRDMLTALPPGGDPLHPTRKGAVLTNAQAVSYAMLEPHSTAHRLDGELKDVQETFVVDSGTGQVAAGGKTFELSKGKAFILTPGLDFKITATGDRYLTFYVVTEKVPPGFAPRASFEVVDNSAKPQTVNAWYNQERPLISKADGMAQYGAVTQVQLKSMAMSRPYSDGKDVEEIWIATDGDTEMLFGKELRRLTPGTAYRVPSTGITAHANINVTGKPAQYLYMVK